MSGLPRSVNWMIFTSSIRIAGTGVEVSDHLKWLANQLPVTFIYAGVGVWDGRHASPPTTS
jgi:hypothetical protein